MSEQADSLAEQVRGRSSSGVGRHENEKGARKRGREKGGERWGGEIENEKERKQRNLVTVSARPGVYVSPTVGVGYWVELATGRIWLIDELVGQATLTIIGWGVIVESAQGA